MTHKILIAVVAAGYLYFLSFVAADCAGPPPKPPSPPFETCMNFCVPYAGYRCVFYGLAGTWSHRNAVDACYWYCRYKTQNLGALPKESYQEWDSLQGDYSLDADGISRPKEPSP